MPADFKGRENIAGEPNNAPDRREADHPRTTYQTPANVLNDEQLSKQQKIEILNYWQQEVEARLRAAAEGMGSSNPISAEQESALADEQGLVIQAQAKLAE